MNDDKWMVFETSENLNQIEPKLPILHPYLSRICAAIRRCVQIWLNLILQAQDITLIHCKGVLCVRVLLLRNHLISSWRNEAAVVSLQVSTCLRSKTHEVMGSNPPVSGSFSSLLYPTRSASLIKVRHRDETRLIFPLKIHVCFAVELVAKQA